MAHLPYPDPDDLPKPVRQTLDALPARFNIFEMLAHSPTTVGHVAQLGVALLGTLEVASAQREMVILWMARRTGAEYEWVQHLPSARAAGTTEAQIQAVHALDLSRDCLSAAQAAALVLTDRIATGSTVTASDIAALSAYFNVRQIVELTVLAGYYLMLARVLTTLDVDLDPQGAALAETFVRSDRAAGGSTPSR
jgi:alkylhydroperoxidase family enzyme